MKVNICILFNYIFIKLKEDHLFQVKPLLITFQRRLKKTIYVFVQANKITCTVHIYNCSLFANSIYYYVRVSEDYVAHKQLKLNAFTL